MRQVAIGLIVASCVALAAGCGPTKHRAVDDWANDDSLEPEITGNSARDEARWRQELASDPWGDDAHLLTDDPPGTALRDEEDNPPPPKDFVGPPAPPTQWEKTQKTSTKVGRAIFSVLTVFVTLGMMAAPYLMMI
jgi:hypothetical protein